MNKNPLKKTSIINLLKNIKINLDSERVTLKNCINRFIAEDIYSKINLPPFNNSAVDGYALHKNDIKNDNKKLILSHRIAAGDKILPLLKPGEVARIFTGARMPINSKTVVMQENTIKKNNIIYVTKMPRYGENCRIAGEDIKKDKKIFQKGKKINSSNINLLAAIGKKHIRLKKKIKVGFYTSGNELINPSETLKNSQINNSNLYSLDSLLRHDFIERKYLGILKDKEESIIQSLKKNINKYDVIITTGGASVGEEDHLINILKKIGKLFFWRASIKPGRPIAVGKINKTIIICLPGNPVSVHLLFGMIIYPFLKSLTGSNFILPQKILAKTNFSMKKKNQRLEWIRVNIHENNNGLIVKKYPKQGSGMISSIAFADGILEIPEKVSFISKGDQYYFYSFKNIFK